MTHEVDHENFKKSQNSQLLETISISSSTTVHLVPKFLLLGPPIQWIHIMKLK